MNVWAWRMSWARAVSGAFPGGVSTSSEMNAQMWAAAERGRAPFQERRWSTTSRNERTSGGAAARLRTSPWASKKPLSVRRAVSAPPKPNQRVVQPVSSFGR